MSATREEARGTALASILRPFARVEPAEAVGVAFYLWVGVFNVTAMAQFWASAADVYTPEQSKRLFALLGIGSSVGAVAGARFAKALVGLGPEGLVATAAVLLLLCLGLIAIADRRFFRDAKERYVTVSIANGAARYPLRAYLYDLGGSAGYRLVGIERRQEP
jgi:hypothetical protein